MSTLSRIKNWITLEILTADDLNAEFNNIVDNIVAGTTTAAGVVQLEDSHASTSTTKAACPKNVKEAYDLAGTMLTKAAFDAGTFMYAVNDNTPVVKTRAEVMALLSGQAGADFSIGTHKITAVVDPTADQDAATKKFVDDKIKAPGEIGGTTAAKINCTTIDLDGGKIVFPATAQASAGVNTLDDYEEGIYTPTLTCATAGGYNLNAAADRLCYTKVGRLVHISGRIDIASESGTPNGALRLSLPFTTTEQDKWAEIAAGGLSIVGHGHTIPGPTIITYGGVAFALFYGTTDSGLEQAVTHASVDTVFYLRIDLHYISE